MPVLRAPLGLRLPPHTPCDPRCPSCTMERLGEVQRALRDQRPDIEDPWVAAVLVVFGVPADA